MRRIQFLTAVLAASLAGACEQSATEPQESAQASEPPVERYLYLSMPDGAQKEGRSKPGILIFAIDNGHEFVRRIDMPVFAEGLRGFAGNLERHSVYYSSTNHRLGRFDLETEETVWEKVYDAGCDRSSVTLDGKKIYVPTGWWYAGEDSGFLVVDGDTGDIIKRLTVGPQAHNSIVNLKGDKVYLGTRTMLSVFDTATDELVMQVQDVGERGVFPFTIDSRERYAYVCLGNHVGFDVVDLQEGEAIHRVFAGPEKIEHRTHGAGLTPDETELWISDQKGQKLFIFDATQMPPVQKGHVDLSQGGHGWVAFSLDGKYAWSHTPDVFDVGTKELVATLRDETGTPVSGSKFVEVHVQDGKVVRIGHEFGLGRAHAD